jgi:cytochrome c-type biogenesis protein CcmH/NrfG
MFSFRDVALLAALAAALSGAPARSADTDTTPAVNAANPDFAAGRKAVEAKDWPVAVAAFERAVKREPKNADAYNMLGYAYRWQYRMSESFAAYNQALALDPNHRGAHEYIGVAYLKAKQPEKAKEHLAKLEAICGKGCEEYQDLAKAIADYR